MSFSFPFSTAPAFRGIIPSDGMRYLNTNFPNCVDKRGDTITGTITFSNTSQMLFDGYALFNNLGTVLEIGNGAVFQCDVNSNAFLFGQVFLEASGEFVTLAGSALNIQGNMTLYSTAVMTIDPAARINGNLTWINTATNPIINQASTASGAGANFSISAQNATSGSGALGGNLLLSSGTSTASTGSSAVILQPVGSGGTMMVHTPIGSINTQLRKNEFYMATATTTTSGSPVKLIDIVVPNNSGMVLKIIWNRKTSTTNKFNESLFGLKCDNTGTWLISFITDYGTPSNDPGVIEASSSAFTFTNNTNLLTISANQNLVADVQVVVNILTN